ncbi:hypothetical protein [Mitsuaria sp. GD03876]|uniref:hypothetical protein n=1 Tax=Mitsuaria sp. GD03876 TaxID=2975399 RepID=UPI0024487AFE|nr:hypothetical protein [Mitsuaria sp. GD03876]MDH0866864.1 hypothetical protein [Mitsuaria sp. GD03876]
MYTSPIPSYEPSERLQTEIHLVALEDNRTDAQVVLRALRLYFEVRRRVRAGSAFGFIEQGRKDLLTDEIEGY